MNFSFNNYNTEGFYDEMFDENGNVRAGYEHFKERVEQLSKEEYEEKLKELNLETYTGFKETKKYFDSLISFEE
jgi:uncharacterized circularly permuted ATP-grasp superfamily protein